MSLLFLYKYAIDYISMLFCKTFIHSKISELAPYFDVKVIIYLRRQDKFMESTS